MVKVGASRHSQLGEQFWQVINFLKGVNQLCFLPITQDLQIDAQAFFYDFVRLLQEIVFELQLSDIALEGFKLSLEFLSFWHFGVGFMTFHR